MRKILISAALASATLVALPAAARPYRGAPVSWEIQRDINQLENRIQRSPQRRAISPREAVGLRREANQLEQTFHRFSRNGLNRREHAELQQSLNRLQARIRLERRDNDNRRF